MALAIGEKIMTGHKDAVVEAFGREHRSIANDPEYVRVRYITPWWTFWRAKTEWVNCFMVYKVTE